MKRIIALLSMLVVFAIFVSCNAKTTVEPYSEPENEITVEETEERITVSATITEESTAEIPQNVKWQTLEESIKQAYLSTIMEYREKYGAEYTPIGETWSHGVAYAVLFDWDQNGVPELFIGYSSEETRDPKLAANVVTNLDIFTYQNDSMHKILSTCPGRTYWQTSAQEYMLLTMNDDGVIVFQLNQSLDTWKEGRRVMYVYKDGQVTQSVLCAYAEEDSDDSSGPPDFARYELDGNPISQDDFMKLYTNDENTIYIESEKKEYTQLLDYLKGTQAYYDSEFVRDRSGWVEDLVREYR